MRNSAMKRPVFWVSAKDRALWVGDPGASTACQTPEWNCAGAEFPGWQTAGNRGGEEKKHTAKK